MIDQFKRGSIIVDGKEYNRDIKIYPDGVVPNWWREKGHELQPQDIPELSSKELQHFVIGCGTEGALKVTPAAKQLFEELGLTWTALHTPAAVEEFNKRLATGKKIGGVFHLTC